MSLRKILIILAISSLSACVTVDDAGRAYFKQGAKVKGVESVESLMERSHKDQKLRDIMYGQLKSAKIFQCTLLRNQLYVASMQTSKIDELNDAVKLMENAYQENDAAFLRACDQILATDLGKKFVKIQQEYLIKVD